MMTSRVVGDDIAGILFSRDDLSAFDNKTVLISGANSFLMSYLIYAILEHGQRAHTNCHVVALCRNQERAEARFGNYLRDSQLEIICQDIRDFVRYDDNIDYCIHAASPAGIFSRQEHPADTFESNLIGCRNLLELSVQKKAGRFLFISSVDVYGKAQTNRRLRESDIGELDWLYARNAYASGKRATETLCLLYKEQYGLPCVIARPFQVYGPGMSLTDGRLNGDFVRQLLQDGVIRLKSDGMARRSFLYLSDATEALLDILLYGNAGGVYNVCDEAGECSVLELAKLYAKVAEGTEPQFLEGSRDAIEVKEAPLAVLGSAERIRTLGWNSKVSLEEGIERT